MDLFLLVLGTELMTSLHAKANSLSLSPSPRSFKEKAGLRVFSVAEFLWNTRRASVRASVWNQYSWKKARCEDTHTWSNTGAEEAEARGSLELRAAGHTVSGELRVQWETLSQKLRQTVSGRDCSEDRGKAWCHWVQSPGPTWWKERNFNSSKLLSNFYTYLVVCMSTYTHMNKINEEKCNKNHGWFRTVIKE